MSTGRRCSICSTDWPDKKLYSECPECQEPTSRIREIDPLDADEALHRKTQAEFERFYERWDSERDPWRLEPTASDNKRFKARLR